MKDNERYSDSIAFEEHLRRVLSNDRECLHGPQKAVQLGEVELGTLENPIAHAIFSLREEIRIGLQKMCEGMTQPWTQEPDEEEKKRWCQFHQARSRYACVDCLFWEMVHTEFPDTRMHTVRHGIRREWKVVIFKKEQAQPIELFGGFAGD